MNEIIPDIRCLKMITSISNVASQSLALSLSFKYSGTLLFNREFKSDYIGEVVYYLVIKDDRKIEK